ncbi:hypothetical protein P9743_04920, partial [Anoxybacillus geothermalis]|nr:hypothetical protein [Anoxybacillus geothermalis]
DYIQGTLFPLLFFQFLQPFFRFRGLDSDLEANLLKMGGHPIPIKLRILVFVHRQKHGCLLQNKNTEFCNEKCRAEGKEKKACQPLTFPLLWKL